MDDIDPVHDADAAPRDADAAHTEVYPGIYEACMNTPGFPSSVLRKALNHMKADKTTAIQFVKMSPEDRNLWITSFLKEHTLIMWLSYGHEEEAGRFYATGQNQFTFILFNAPLMLL